MPDNWKNQEKPSVNWQEVPKEAVLQSMSLCLVKRVLLKLVPHLREGCCGLCKCWPGKVFMNKGFQHCWLCLRQDIVDSVRVFVRSGRKAETNNPTDIEVSFQKGTSRNDSSRTLTVNTVKLPKFCNLPMFNF